MPPTNSTQVLNQLLGPGQNLTFSENGMQYTIAYSFAAF